MSPIKSNFVGSTGESWPGMARISAWNSCLHNNPNASLPGLAPTWLNSKEHQVKAQYAEILFVFAYGLITRNFKRILDVIKTLTKDKQINIDQG
jgi:hypothetical protein